MPHTPSRFRLRLHGSPVLTGPSGARVDIKSKRALALLAMLAVAPGQERQRAWLVGQLWSTREHAQALGSLRQELHVLRQTTGLHGDLIGSDHSRVWILEDGLELEQPEHGANAQFLEGIDIPGAEGFEEWLRDVRGAVDIPSLPPETHRGGTKAPSATSPRPLVIEIVLTSPAPQAGRGNALCAMLGRSLHEAGGIQVQIGGTPSGALPPDLRVLVDLQEFAEEALASLMVHRVFDGALLVSYSAALPASSTSGDSPMRMLSAFASTAVDQILNALIRDKAVFESERFLAARAATEGFLTLFSRRDDAALKADRCFAEAVDAFDDAAFYAGWAYLGALLLEEQPRSSHAEIRERAREYAARAEELDPQNGLAAALLTHVHAFVLRDLTRAEAFNERALALRPAHVLTQDATALLHLYRGNASSARAAANSAEELGKLLPYRYALATTKAMIETVSGNYKLGLQEAERALALQPLAATRPYPPILRYMGICQAELAHLEEAQRTFESLEKQEGQLRLTSLNPEDYPVPSPDAMQLMRRSVGRLKREDP
ncbi:MAG: hypothetical protein AAGB05_15145 [Pseudomonadota bacterium]